MMKAPQSRGRLSESGEKRHSFSSTCLDKTTLRTSAWRITSRVLSYGWCTAAIASRGSSVAIPDGEFPRWNGGAALRPYRFRFLGSSSSSDDCRLASRRRISFLLWIRERANASYSAPLGYNSVQERHSRVVQVSRSRKDTGQFAIELREVSGESR